AFISIKLKVVRFIPIITPTDPLNVSCSIRELLRYIMRAPGCNKHMM
ncbi:32221_t:CDS:2, partial [Gigaspora margarita]